MIALLGAAWAGVVASGALLIDTPTDQVMVGPQLLIVCGAERGFCWTGRFALGFDTRGPELAGVTEVGGLVVIPSTEVATIRFGGGVRGIHIQRRVPIVLQWEEPAELLRWGLVPQVFVQGELAWTPDQPLVLGANVGVSPWAASEPTCIEGDNPDACISWNASFVASFWGRKTLGNGLSFQAGFGTLIEGSVGYAF